MKVETSIKQEKVVVKITMNTQRGANVVETYLIGALYQFGECLDKEEW